MVPGLGLSPDKMLQGRLFAYHDAQLYRVGTNHQHLPVNRPRCPFHHQQRDGAMAGTGADNNGGAAPNYHAIDAAGVMTQGFGHGDPGWAVEGTAGRHDPRGRDDDHTQAGNLFRLLPAAERQNLFDNIANAMAGVAPEIQARQLAHFDRADPTYGAGVRAALAAREPR